jgi:predicted nucleic acid-binding protein
MKPVLLDTGAVVALLDRSERHHQACVAAMAELQAPLVTCEPVIAEACYLLRRLPGAVDAILENVQQRIFEVPLNLQSQAREVRALLKKYARVPMDPALCTWRVSWALAKSSPSTAPFTSTAGIAPARSTYW